MFPPILLALLAACTGSQPKPEPVDDTGADTDGDDTGDTPHTGETDVDTGDTDPDTADTADTVFSCGDTGEAICGDAGCTWAIDAAFVTVGGTVTYRGGDLGRQEITGGKVYLRDPRGEYFSTEFEDDGAWSARVLPGTYDIVVDLYGDGAPAREIGVTRDADLSADATLPLDVSAARVSGTVTLDGAPIAADIPVQLQFALADGQAWRVYPEEGGWEIDLAAGTYDVTLVASLEAGSVSALVAEGVEVSGDTAGLSFDARFHEVWGDVTLNGVSLTDAIPTLEHYRVYLEAPTGGGSDWFERGELWVMTVAEGTYDAWVNVRGSDNVDGAMLPAGTLEVTADGTWTLDASAVLVSGTVAIDGLPTPEEGDTHELNATFTDTVSGEQHVVEPSPGFALYLPPGTYDVRASLDDTYPVVSDVLLAEGLEIADATTLDLTGEVFPVTGTVTIDGAVPAPGDGITNSVSFEGSRGQTATAAADEGGAYMLYVDADVYDADVSFMEWRGAGAAGVTLGAAAGLDLPIMLYDVTLALPADWDPDEVRASLASEHGSDGGEATADGWTAKVIAGVYEVYVTDQGDGTDEASRGGAYLDVCLEVGP